MTLAQKSIFLNVLMPSRSLLGLFRRRIRSNLFGGVILTFGLAGFCVAQEPNKTGSNSVVEDAAKSTSEVVENLPENWRAYLQRGEIRFRAGKIAESLVDFDKSLALNPAMAASFWQRGLSLYYAGDFQAGREQFELHRTVNSSDVENPFWHFLCVAKIEGVDSAQKKILPCGYDGREPLMDILELIRGTKTFEEVARIVDAIDKDSKQKVYDRFYGNYYLGLYSDALGQKERAEVFLKKAVDEKLPGYMPDAARVHLDLLQKDKLPNGKR
jgi:tetratricopeptide (TPR) repeat protein